MSLKPCCAITSRSCARPAACSAGIAASAIASAWSGADVRRAARPEPVRVLGALDRRHDRVADRSQRRELPLRQVGHVHTLPFAIARSPDSRWRKGDTTRPRRSLGRRRSRTGRGRVCCSRAERACHRSGPRDRASDGSPAGRCRVGRDRGAARPAGRRIARAREPGPDHLYPARHHRRRPGGSASTRRFRAGSMPWSTTPVWWWAARSRPSRPPSCDASSTST